MPEQNFFNGNGLNESMKKYFEQKRLKRKFKEKHSIETNQTEIWSINAERKWLERKQALIDWM